MRCALPVGRVVPRGEKRLKARPLGRCHATFVLAEKRVGLLRVAAFQIVAHGPFQTIRRRGAEGRRVADAGNGAAAGGGEYAPAAASRGLVAAV